MLNVKYRLMVYQYSKFKFHFAHATTFSCSRVNTNSKEHTTRILEAGELFMDSHIKIANRVSQSTRYAYNG